MNLFTKPAATVSGVLFSGLLFLGFAISERRNQRTRGKAHVGLDKFNLAQASELTPENLGVRPGNILVAVSTQNAMYHLEDALRRAKRGRTEIVVLHVQLLQRGTYSESDLEAGQLFDTYEQVLFTKVLAVAEKHGKPVKLAVAAANDLWDGMLRTAANLESSTIVAGSSGKVTRERAGPRNRPCVGAAWRAAAAHFA